MKLKYISFFLLSLCTMSLSLTTESQAYTCPQKVNPQKTVVFVDLNFSIQEIEFAQKAACERGETFTLIAGISLENMLVAQSTYQEIARLEKLRSEARNITLEDELSPSDHINTVIQSKINQLKTNTKYTPVNLQKINSTLQQLKNHQVKITSLILSGHDGGGSFRSDSHTRLGSQDLDKQQIINSLKSTYSPDGKLLDEFKSVYLWGCYTNTPSESKQWADSFSQLKLISGFLGAGPSSKITSSSEMLATLLKTEKSYYTIQSAAELKSKTNQLQNYSIMSAALTVINGSGDCHRFYNGQSYSGSEVTKLTDTLSTLLDCKSPFISKLTKELDNHLSLYEAGALPISDNTDESPLRSLYNTSRVLEGCLNTQSTFHPTRVGLLLFYNNVQKNFNAVFKSQKDSLKKDLLEMSKKMNDYSQDSLYQQSSLHQYLLAKVNLESDSFKNLKESIENEKQNNLAHLKATLSAINKIPQLTREELGTLLQDLNHIYNDQRPEYKEYFKNYKTSINTYRDKLEKYLYSREPGCMDFLEWHDYDPQHLPKAKC